MISSPSSQNMCTPAATSVAFTLAHRAARAAGMLGSYLRRDAEDVEKV